MKVKDYILKFKDNFDGFEITITDIFEKNPIVIPFSKDLNLDDLEFQDYLDAEYLEELDASQDEQYIDLKSDLKEPDYEKGRRIMREKLLKAPNPVRKPCYCISEEDGIKNLNGFWKGYDDFYSEYLENKKESKIDLLKSDIEEFEEQLNDFGCSCKHCKERNLRILKYLNDYKNLLREKFLIF